MSLKSDFVKVLRRKKSKAQKVGAQHNTRELKAEKRKAAKRRRLLAKLGANIHITKRMRKLGMTAPKRPVIEVPKFRKPVIVPKI